MLLFCYLHLHLLLLKAKRQVFSTGITRTYVIPSLHRGMGSASKTPKAQIHHSLAASTSLSYLASLGLIFLIWKMRKVTAPRRSAVRVKWSNAHQLLPVAAERNHMYIRNVRVYTHIYNLVNSFTCKSNFTTWRITKSVNKITIHYQCFSKLKNGSNSVVAIYSLRTCSVLIAL